MKRLMIVLGFAFAGLSMMCSNAFGAVPPDSLPVDTTIEYLSVNIVVQCEWTDTEQIEDVDVAVTYVNQIPVAVKYFKFAREKGEYRITDGVVIRLYNHETGELIKVLTKTRMVI